MKNNIITRLGGGSLFMAYTTRLHAAVVVMPQYPLPAFDGNRRKKKKNQTRESSLLLV